MATGTYGCCGWNWRMKSEPARTGRPSLSRITCNRSATSSRASTGGWSCCPGVRRARVTSSPRMANPQGCSCSLWLWLPSACLSQPCSWAISYGTATNPGTAWGIGAFWACSSSAHSSATSPSSRSWGQPTWTSSAQRNTTGYARCEIGPLTSPSRSRSVPCSGKCTVCGVLPT